MEREQRIKIDDPVIAKQLEDQVLTAFFEMMYKQNKLSFEEYTKCIEGIKIY
jgi:hypothetical protein